MIKDRRFHNIMFDLDGTLTDPAEGITGAVAYALEKCGIHVEDHSTLNKFIGPPLIGSFMEYYGMTEAEARACLGYYREYFSDRGIFENEIYPGMAALLKKLKEAGRQLIVATSKPEEFTHMILEHFGIAGYFDFVGGNTLDEKRPEKADVIAHILASVPGLTPQNTVMVGDRKYDVEGAAKFDISCIGVLYGYGGIEELSAANAAYIAEDIDGLEKILL